MSQIMLARIVAALFGGKKGFVSIKKFNILQKQMESCTFTQININQRETQAIFVKTVESQLTTKIAKDWSLNL